MTDGDCAELLSPAPACTVLDFVVLLSARTTPSIPSGWREIQLDSQPPR